MERKARVGPCYKAMAIDMRKRTHLFHAHMLNDRHREEAG